MSRRSSPAAVSALAMGALCAAAVILAAAPAQTVEWLFQYNGNGDSALIALGADPVGSIGVKVYDEGQWRDLAAGDASVQPVGRGTRGTLNPWLTDQDLITNGKLFWEAKAHPAVKFHIQVSNLIQQPALYWIAAAGPGAGSLTLVTPAGVTTSAAVNPALTAQTAPAQGAAPQMLPPTGADARLPLGAAGLALMLAGLIGQHGGVSRRS